MDNLAHSFVGAVVGCALAPALAAKHRRRLMLASAAVANCPDLDIVLVALGQQTYMFHHRGFTHSLVGLCLMVPLGLLIFTAMMGRQRLIAIAGRGAWGSWAFFVLAQLVFSHYLLDYFTSYGTLFLYPFSWQRFSYPLMFILDPALWLTSGVGFLLLFYKDLARQGQIARVAWGTLAAITLLWGGELTAKKGAEAAYRQLNAVTSAAIDSQLQSYPAPLAPFFWILLEKQSPRQQEAENPPSFAAGDGPRYQQAAISYVGKKGHGVRTWWQEPIPAQFEHGQLCRELRGQAAAQQSFERFASWAEHTVCDPFTWQEQAGCRCLSLKYSLLGLGGVAYGAYWIGPDGRGEFLPPESRSSLLQAYRQFLPLPAASDDL